MWEGWFVDWQLKGQVPLHVPIAIELQIQMCFVWICNRGVKNICIYGELKATQRHSRRIWFEFGVIHAEIFDGNSVVFSS